ncbi:MAG: hypothetical protein QXT20_03930 [Candidatus Woesearchaeota archaeon]
MLTENAGWRMKNMDRKLAYVIFMLGLLAVLSGVAFAEEAQPDNSTEVNESEITPFLYPLGAEVRLLQLQKSILRNIAAGEYIIEQIKSANSSTDTSMLEAKLDGLRALSDEVNELISELNTTTKSADELAQQFVDIKAQAINLTQEFRKTASPMLKEATRDRIRLRIQDMERTQLQNISDQIQQMRRAYNAQFLNITLQKLGVNNDSLIEAVRSGNASQKEVHEYLKGIIQSAPPSERVKLLSKINENMKRISVYNMAVKNRILERKTERLQERQLNLEKRINQLRQRNESIGQRIERIYSRYKNSSSIPVGNSKNENSRRR